MPDFGLKEGELLAIKETFKGDSRILGAAIFGSRAKGNYKPYSDVDIALYGHLNTFDVESVISELDDLPLVYQFDVVAYELVNNPELREHIERIGIRIYEKGQHNTP
ncbi:MAG: nucleotidyltransferase domain-containing protein [Planctomycetaceae bacterium]|jgi:predicted nucleotidyltransferase|nr:nucleotidyltransferase domain-containing protein [Planctomycetaceae bacterium]